MCGSRGRVKERPNADWGYYDTLNLSASPWVAGHNTIAILALYLGRRTVPAGQTWWNNEHLDSGVHAVLVSGNVCESTVSSDSSWRAVPHPAYSNDITDDLAENFRASEPDTVFDARADVPMQGWTSNNFTDSAWPQCVVRGVPGGPPWGELVERPIRLFVRSPVMQRIERVRVETDGHDGDGFRGLGAGDIGGMDLRSPLPAGCCDSIAACKAACVAKAACRAAVWNPSTKSCNLKAVTLARLSSTSPYVVFVRAYKRLIGTLPYDTQLTPTLRVPVRTPNVSGLRIDIRTDSYFTDATMADKAAGLGIPNTRAAYLVDTSSSSSLSSPASSSSLSLPTKGDFYESPGWMVGHEVRFTVDAISPIALEGPGTLEVGYYATGYDTTLTRAFHCSNPSLTTLWKKAQRTLYVNMRDS